MKRIIKKIKDEATAIRIGKFMTGPNTFDQTWAPNEKKYIEKAPLVSLKNSNHQYWYIEEDGEIIGAIGVRENKYGSSGYEMDADYLAIHKQYRRIGLGRLLLKEMENFVKKKKGRYIHILTCDIASYKPARCFWIKNNYKKVCEIPDYYVEGEGRVDYLKKLI